MKQDSERIPISSSSSSSTTTTDSPDNNDNNHQHVAENTNSSNNLFMETKEILIGKNSFPFRAWHHAKIMCIVALFILLLGFVCIILGIALLTSAPIKIKNTIDDSISKWENTYRQNFDSLETINGNLSTGIEFEATSQNYYSTYGTEIFLPNYDELSYHILTKLWENNRNEYQPPPQVITMQIKYGAPSLSRNEDVRFSFEPVFNVTSSDSQATCQHEWIDGRCLTVYRVDEICIKLNKSEDGKTWIPSDKFGGYGCGYIPRDYNRDRIDGREYPGPVSWEPVVFAATTWHDVVHTRSHFISVNFLSDEDPHVLGVHLSDGDPHFIPRASGYFIGGGFSLAFGVVSMPAFLVTLAVIYRHLKQKQYQQIS